MKKSNLERTKQLGMDIGTATARLKKNLMFSLIVECGKDICFQCKKKIVSVDEMSIEHKIPYLHSENPQELFFGLDNISFSHLKCNVNARRKSSIPPKQFCIRGHELNDKKLVRCKKCREQIEYPKRKR
jgi:uncharacterized protein with PIN domain